ncbi:unnamed protein product [Brassica napus]|uniref:(rape) hypothetical protein n=1 Tax=Brassica napus TaxID=3708 RepID=A0A816P1Y0_BRANA|nr:unnamed protein product [Brassica napus]
MKKTRTMETRGLDFSIPLNSLEISLIELGDLVNAGEEEMGEWTKASDMRVAALEEKDRACDMIVVAFEAYVEKVGEDSPEDSPQDVKEKEKKGKGVKRKMLILLYENVKTKVVVTNLVKKKPHKSEKARQGHSQYKAVENNYQ